MCNVDKLKNVGMSDKPRLEHFTSRLLTKPSTVLQLHPAGHAATPPSPTAQGSSVVLDSLQDLLPPAIVHNVLYCCPSKHLTGLWAGCCSLLDSAHFITSTTSQLHLKGLLLRFSIVKSGIFSKVHKEIVWRLLELRSKSYKLGSLEKVTGFIVVREHELRYRDEIDLDIRMGNSEER